MATKATFNKQKTKISIHINELGEVVDVAGIPANVGMVVTNIDDLSEEFFSKGDNCQ
jgi:hypothetical protein